MTQDNRKNTENHGRERGDPDIRVRERGGEHHYTGNQVKPTLICEKTFPYRAIGKVEDGQTSSKAVQQLRAESKAPAQAHSAGNAHAATPTAGKSAGQATGGQSTGGQGGQGTGGQSTGGQGGHGTGGHGGHGTGGHGGHGH
jgi:hypothetical protein